MTTAEKAASAYAKAFAVVGEVTSQAEFAAKVAAAHAKCEAGMCICRSCNR